MDLGIRRNKTNLKVALGLPKLQNQVHHPPKVKTKMLPIHLHMTTKNLEDKKCLKKLALHLKSNSKKRQLQGGTKVRGMNVISMVIVMHVTVLVTRLWVVLAMGEEVLEFQII